MKIQWARGPEGDSAHRPWRTSPAPRRTRGIACAPALAIPLGCAPTVDVLGVYFPGWLVSVLTGVATSYGLVWWLGRRPGAKSLAESGLFFVSLVVGVALAVWWIFFSGF